MNGRNATRSLNPSSEIDYQSDEFRGWQEQHSRNPVDWSLLTTAKGLLVLEKQSHCALAAYSVVKLGYHRRPVMPPD
jgi:hypothetical protein